MTAFGLWVPTYVMHSSFSLPSFASPLLPFAPLLAALVLCGPSGYVSPALPFVVGPHPVQDYLSSFY